MTRLTNQNKPVLVTRIDPPSLTRMTHRTIPTQAVVAVTVEPTANGQHSPLRGLQAQRERLICRGIEASMNGTLRHPLTNNKLKPRILVLSRCVTFLLSNLVFMLNYILVIIAISKTNGPYFFRPTR